MMRTRWNWVLIAVLVWVGLGGGLAVHAYLAPRAHTVYDIYALAAQNWWSGKDLYVVGREHYRYSPLFAILLTPLALLPDQWGTPLWKVFNIGLYALGLWAWGGQVLPARLTGNQLAALFLLAVPSSLHSMYNGQANLVVLGACLLGLAAAAGNRWNQSACWLALATLTKGYPLGLALLLAVFYPRRFGARFAAALGIGLLLPFAAQRPSVVLAQNLSWWHHLRDSTVIMRERLRSMDHLFQIYYHPLDPSTFARWGVLAGAVLLVLCLVHARRGVHRPELLTYTWLLFSAWVVLFGPATESCTYAVIAPSIAWSLVDVFRRPARWAVRLWLWASLLLMGPLVTDLFGSTLRNFANEHGSQPIGALLLLVYLLAQTGRRVPAVPEPATSPPITARKAA